jgi:small redox-active disulfide protein 2
LGSILIGGIMGLFNKKKEEKFSGFTCALCNNSVDETTDITIDEKVESIKVLGAGCPSCHKQYEYAMEAVNNLNLDVKVEYVTNYDDILKYNVMSMPSLVINEKVVATGKLISIKNLEKILVQYGK